LDCEIFDIPLNKWVYDKYLNATSDSDNYVIMATGRIRKLKTQVDILLNKFNLSFDEVHLKSGPGDTLFFKTRLFESLILEHSPQEFVIYDDREEHLEKFYIWATTQPCDITIIDVVNKIEKKFKNNK
jgi:hypothetical protein